MITLTGLMMVSGIHLAQPIQSESQATVYWVNHCQTRAAAGTNANFREACACVAGLMAGKTTPRQYILISEIAPGLDSQEIMSPILQRLQDDGYSLEEIQTVAQIMAEAEDDINQVCKVLE